MTRIGLVVLNYNNAEETVRVLESVSSMSVFTAIEVVDNCSEDDSLCRLEKAAQSLEDSRIEILETQRNRGYAYGNNAGIEALLKRVSCDVLLISNPDVVFDEPCVKLLAEVLESSDAVAAAPMMKNREGRLCRSAWKLPTRTTMLLSALRLLGPIIGDPLAYGELVPSSNSYATQRVEVLPGSLMMVKTQAFLDVGGFDEDTFLYGEENLLFSKYREKGWEGIICLGLSYVHAHGTSISRSLRSLRARYLVLLEANLVYCAKVLRAGKCYHIIYKLLYKLDLVLYIPIYSLIKGRRASQ